MQMVQLQCSTLRLRVFFFCFLSFAFSLSLFLSLCECIFNPPLSFSYAWMIFHIARPDFIYVLRWTLLEHPTYSRRLHYIQMNKRKKTDNNLQDEIRIFVLSSNRPCTQTHRHIQCSNALFFGRFVNGCVYVCLFALTIFQVGKNGHSVQQAAIKWNYWIKTNLNSRDTRHDTTRTNNDMKVKRKKKNELEKTKQ